MLYLQALKLDGSLARRWKDCTTSTVVGLLWMNIVHQREIRVLNGMFHSFIQEPSKDVFLTDLKLKARICNFKDELYIN